MEIRGICLVAAVFILLTACNEKLIEKPDNLIPEDKMVKVLKDLAIVNAAKTTNVAVLQENDIEPMSYIYEKHGIDSTQLVESDRYYASLPDKYEEIYQKVEAGLEQDTKAMEKEKEVNDSLRRLELENKGGKTYMDKLKDSVP
ncbi:MAG: DUF4296 domain-containing protein [Pricia sp.]